MNDRVLVEKAQDGDREAFGELFVGYQDDLHNYARRFLSRKEEAEVEDICLTSWMKAWDKIRDFRGEGDFKSWLFTICRHEALNWLRNRNNLTMETAANSEETMKETVAELKDPSPSVHAFTESKEFIDLLVEATRSLTTRRFATYNLALRGFQNKEIAQILNTTGGNVNALLYYARAEIRTILGQQGFRSTEMPQENITAILKNHVQYLLDQLDKITRDKEKQRCLINRPSAN